MSKPLTIRYLGRQPYEPIWRAMQTYTENRTEESADEIWFVEHDPVFTQGQAGDASHILNAGDIPVVQVDRGGQVTYHGPGQQVMYFMIDLPKRNLGVRKLVTAIEDTVIAMLADSGIEANADPKAPGVYVDGRKIASLGLRIKKGRSFHGLALNVDMDLAPFLQINPCGYAGMEMAQCKHLGGPESLAQAQQGLLKHFTKILDISDIISVDGLA